MNKLEWQLHHGFIDEDMYIMQGWMIYYCGNITEIFKEKLSYDTLKYNK